MMKTDWSLPPKKKHQEESFSCSLFVISCHFVRLKTLFRGLSLCKSPFKAQMLTFILYVQSYENYYNDQSFIFTFIVSSKQLYFVFVHVV